MDGARYQVFGKVQGVGYRYFAQRAGLELRLRGWVKNLSDGSVTVAAVGPAAELQQLEQRLRAGPPAARVERVEVRPWQPQPHEAASLRAFHIVHE